MPNRVLLILPTRTYRAAAFLTAARRLKLEVVVAAEEGSTLSHLHPDQELVIDLDDPLAAAQVVAERAGNRQIDAVVPVDDAAVLAAAQIAERLGLRGSPVQAVAATRNKLAMRECLQTGAVDQLRWWLWPGGADPGPVEFPAVIKPLDQAASRGVIRVDDRSQLLRAGQRIRRGLSADPGCPTAPDATPLLVEEFVAGPEVALEGLLMDGALRVLAVYDKPDPLDGPFFEETIYTVPSELPADRLNQVSTAVQRATRAIGLTDGSVHAELRLGRQMPCLIDLASRSIGGRCSAVLHFQSGRSLEEIVLLAALGEGPGDLALEEGTCGVMMMPIPRAGTLLSVDGRERALELPGVDGVELTVPLGGRLLPLPEGDRYLGFIFAHGQDAQTVSSRLRAAYRDLRISIGD
ncbi:MAG: ATP-grasp domain-containing protein [Candidatus Dormiibacterota bacterium]